jgi:MFS family permease
MDGRRDEKSGEETSRNEKDAANTALKAQVFRGVYLQMFLAVVAHTLNLQTEAILIRNACNNDLGKAAQVGSISNAAAGGKLSDSMGRKPFYLLGPLCQVLSGLCCFAMFDNALVLAGFRALKVVGTTFSGTVIGSAAMRDMFQGEELATKSAQGGSIVGLAIMTGPLLESFLLKSAKAGNERIGFLAMAMLGLAAGTLGRLKLPESLSSSSKKPFDVSTVVSDVNPFGFLRIYTHGSIAARKLATICCLQTLIDGKNVSDIVQIWTREHIKLQMETIRNFVMGYGLASTIAGAKLVPYLLKNLSTYGFTTFTNITNFFGFIMRGSVANVYVFFGALPLMLPGVNAASTSALMPVLMGHMQASGFGNGESSAYINNLRVIAGAIITMLYGKFYAWCCRTGLNPGLTFSFGACVGALAPQLLLHLTVQRSELKSQKNK